MIFPYGKMHLEWYFLKQKWFMERLFWKIFADKKAISGSNFFKLRAVFSWSVFCTFRKGGSWNHYCAYGKPFWKQRLWFGVVFLEVYFVSSENDVPKSIILAYGITIPEAKFAIWNSLSRSVFFLSSWMIIQEALFLLTKRVFRKIFSFLKLIP